MIRIKDCYRDILVTIGYPKELGDIVAQYANFKLDVSIDELNELLLYNAATDYCIKQDISNEVFVIGFLIEHLNNLKLPMPILTKFNGKDRSESMFLKWYDQVTDNHFNKGIPNGAETEIKFYHDRTTRFGLQSLEKVKTINFYFDGDRHSTCKRLKNKKHASHVTNGECESEACELNKISCWDICNIIRDLSQVNRVNGYYITSIEYGYDPRRNKSSIKIILSEYDRVARYYYDTWKQYYHSHVLAP